MKSRSEARRMDEGYHPIPVDDSGGNIPYISYVNNQTNITNLNYVEWSNVLTKPTFGAVAFNSEYDSLNNVPFKRNATNDIIYRGNKVGIGLQEGQSPINKLHLIGDLFITENYDTWDFLRFYHTGDTAFLDFGGVENGVAFRMNTGITSFENNPSLDEVMRFRNNKVGILTNNLQYSLDVNGSINTKSLYVNGVDLNTIVNTLIDDNVISYNSLTDKPTLFSGSYTDLTSKPTIFSGSYIDLTNKPTYFLADWTTTIANKPTLFSGSYTDLTSKPTLFSGSYTDLTSKPTLFSGSYTDLTSKPTNFQADWSTTRIGRFVRAARIRPCMFIT